MTSDRDDSLSDEEFADGMALWEELKPQDGHDWVRVAERFNRDDGDRSKSSPLFAGLSVAVADSDHYRKALADLLMLARGNQYVLDKIHRALDYPPSKEAQRDGI